MTEKDKKLPSVKLSDLDFRMIYGRDDEGPDIVKSVSERFNRVLDEVLGENFRAPVKEEDGGRDR